MDSVTGLIVSLDEAARLPAQQVGGKARNLAILRRAGFPVPDGYVITTDGFIRFAKANGFDAGASPDSVQAAELPIDVVSGLRLALERLDGPVAIRSSGVAEDLEGASYAGQYESVLGVDTVARAEEAVRRCWASAFGEHLLHYHQANGNHGVPGMAVLVQRMVPADAAGVAFSANPVSGARDEVVINAVPGLADRLVAGEIDGEHWSVQSGAAVRAEGEIQALSTDEALRVAKLAVDVARHFGSPQDIEWGIIDDALHLLQARPITSLPLPQIPVDIEVPDGYWERESSHAPRPWSPLASSLIYDVRNPPLRQVMADFGLLIEAIEFTEIGGWEYMRLVPLGGKDRPTPPGWLMPVLTRMMPAMRRRIRQSVEAVRSDLAGQHVDRWYQEWRPQLAGSSASLRSVDISLLSAADLASHWSGVLEHLRDGARIHFTLHAATCFPLAELAFASVELLGWDEARVWALLAGLSRMSTEPSRRLSALAKMAASRPDTRRVIVTGGVGAVNRLRRTDPEFAAQLASYLDEFGMQALSYDPATPALGEQPELVLGLLADQLSRGFDAAAGDNERARCRASALDEARAVLTARSQSDQRRWERAFSRAERAYPIREDNEFSTLSRPLAIVRTAALEIGSRLAERRQTDSDVDIFYLRHDEVSEAILDGQPRVDLVATRKAERAWVEAHPGPPTYGKKPGPPPPLEALPDEARLANESLLWYAERIFEAERSSQNRPGGEITGLPAAPGQYEGLARIVRGQDEFAKIRAGDVLVCPITSPVWSVLFPSIGALVTDTGGVLSHPAIIAREYGVPAVVATGNATQRLQDGQVIRVDGAAGLVTTCE